MLCCYLVYTSSCKVRLTQDMKLNKLTSNAEAIIHDHPPISIRRRAGNLKAERKHYGLDPEYRKKKCKK